MKLSGSKAVCLRIVSQLPFAPQREWLIRAVSQSYDRPSAIVFFVSHPLSLLFVVLMLSLPLDLCSADEGDGRDAAVLSGPSVNSDGGDHCVDYLPLRPLSPSELKTVLVEISEQYDQQYGSSPASWVQLAGGAAKEYMSDIFSGLALCVAAHALTHVGTTLIGDLAYPLTFLCAQSFLDDRQALDRFDRYYRYLAALIGAWRLCLPFIQDVVAYPWWFRCYMYGLEQGTRYSTLLTRIVSQWVDRSDSTRSGVRRFLVSSAIGRMIDVRCHVAPQGAKSCGRIDIHVDPHVTLATDQPYSEYEKLWIDLITACRAKQVTRLRIQPGRFIGMVEVELWSREEQINTVCSRWEELQEPIWLTDWLAQKQWPKPIATGITVFNPLSAAVLVHLKRLFEGQSVKQMPKDSLSLPYVTDNAATALLSLGPCGFLLADYKRCTSTELPDVLIDTQYFSEESLKAALNTLDSSKKWVEPEGAGSLLGRLGRGWLISFLMEKCIMW